jgi:hypothetical protein
VLAINRAGTHAAGLSWDAQQFTRVFRWSGGNLTPLGPVPTTAVTGGITGISDNGDIVLGWIQRFDGKVSTLLWEAGRGQQDLGEWSPTYLSEDGRIIMGTQDGRAVVWTADAGLRTVKEILAAEGVDVSDVSNVEYVVMSGDQSTLIGRFKKAGGSNSVFRVCGLTFRAPLPPSGVFAWGPSWTSVVPVPADLGAVRQVDLGGGHAIGLLESGRVTAWGLDGLGQTSVPPDLAEVVEVAGGSSHSVARRRDGTVVCWGAGTFVGGGGDTSNCGQSIVPAGLGSVIRIAAGMVHTLALRQDGKVVGWGAGSPDTITAYDYAQSDPPSELGVAIEIAAGGCHSLAVTAAGTVAAWGAGRSDSQTWPEFGQSTVPASLSGVTQVAAGSSHSVALRGDGVVWAWGRNEWGQAAVPPDLDPIVQVAAGPTHTLALTARGTVVGWGSDWHAECSGPTSLRGITQVSAGPNLTLVVVDATDCDDNGVQDVLEIRRGDATDQDGDLRIDHCQQAFGDLDLSGIIDSADIGHLLLHFGSCPPQGFCTGDLDASGQRDAADLGTMLTRFGPVQ